MFNYESRNKLINHMFIGMFFTLAFLLVVLLISKSEKGYIEIVGDKYIEDVEIKGYLTDEIKLNILKDLNSKDFHDIKIEGTTKPALKNEKVYIYISTGIQHSIIKEGQAK